MAKFELPELPYAQNALEPFMSAETLQFHHGKHHRAYVNKTNELIQGTQYENASSLEEIFLNCGEGPLFNNSAQVWNHTFYWHSLKPKGAKLDGELKRAIDRDFGSFDAFQKKFAAAAVGQFGSGWAWLVRNDVDGKVSIETTANAKNPVRSGTTPLVTVDVWEHAYYIDYRNDRAKFLDQMWNLLNWEFAAKNFAGENPAKQVRRAG